MATSAGDALKFRYTRGDYLAAMGTRYGRTMRAKIELGGSILLLLLGILCFGVLSGVNPALGPALILLAPYLIGVGIGGLVLTCQHYGLSLRSVMGEDVTLGDEYTLGFDDEAIILTSAHSHFRADWDYYVDAAATKRVYLLFWAPNVYTLIPRRAFASAGVERAFREAISRKIPSAAALAP